MLLQGALAPNILILIDWTGNLLYQLKHFFMNFLPGEMNNVMFCAKKVTKLPSLTVRVHFYNSEGSVSDPNSLSPDPDTAFLAEYRSGSAFNPDPGLL